MTTPIKIIRDYIERSTHWQEGGATRHDALKVALPALEDTIRAAALELTAGMDYVQRVVNTKEHGVSYETMQRSGFRRPDGWRRKYTLADARSHASTAEIRLRNAWELLDPVSPASQTEAQRTALSNCQERHRIAQEQLRIAVCHLQAVLNKARTHDEQQAADSAARDWLISIGSEP